MPNRLAREPSPYLKQHADNPVDWYPWGDEALERAAREDRPILLSIGYSACHWCHVMAHESFEDAAIAQRMNESFVNVKVDREERPDLDQIYQLVVQLTGRNGGWPLTVFLTPRQKPFFGGTYFPPVDRYGMPGFPKVLEAVAHAYRARRDQVDAQAEDLARAIGQAVAGEGRGGRSVVPDTERIARATEKLRARFDDEHGGFGDRPKFPNASALELLLRRGDHARVGKALDAMRAGGIWDHLAGGFHRYSTDERWLVPHFEKMLYDNAQLLRLYAEASRAMGRPGYAATARQIAAYVAREMTAPEGGFYATQDADTEGHEGRYFVWTPAEVDAACGTDAPAARVAKLAFGVTDEGNFEGSGASVLSDAVDIDAVAGALGMPAAEAAAALERARALLLAARDRREKPLRDEKILASWNGLMAGALARAGAALGEPGLVEAARRALAFVERALVRVEPDGQGGSRARVLRLIKDGDVRGPGFLDDHAFVADASLDLYEATGDAHAVAFARSIADAILAHFRDPGERDFFFTPDDGESILVRPKDTLDNAVPSSTAVTGRVLLRLGTLLGGPYAEAAADLIEKLGPAAVESPLAMSLSLSLADRAVRGSTEVVVVGPIASAATASLARAAAEVFAPDRLIAWLDPGDPASVAACAALAEGKQAQADPVAYVCRGRTCSLPLRTADELVHALAEG